MDIRSALAVVLAAAMGLACATAARAEDGASPPVPMAERYAPPEGATPPCPTGYERPRSVPCPPRTCYPRRRCEWRVGLNGWLPGMDGNLTLGGQPNEIDFDWTDWFDNLDKIDFSLQLTLGYRYERWWGEVRGMVMKLGDSVPIEQAPGAAIDATLNIVALKGIVGWDISRCSLGSNRRWPCLTSSLYAGARLYSMGIEANLQGPPGGPRRVIDSTETWVDPVIGGRLWLDIDPCWSLYFDGDIGGFGVGSDFCWHAELGAEWRPVRWFALQAGWNILDVDYETGSGADLFQFDLQMSGPYVALMFYF